MKERGILFSSAMVLALLAGTKTQTRRIINPQPVFEGVESFGDSWKWQRGSDGFSGVTTEQLIGPAGLLHESRCPYQVGDRLWVRETWRATERASDCIDGILFAADDAFVPIEPTAEAAEKWVIAYDNGKHGDNWRPSIFMPRWASRIQREVIDVRVQRIQDISEEDAWAEGFHDPDGANRQYPDRARYWFKTLWDSLNAARGFGWEKNDWVWAYTLKEVA